MDSGVEHVGPPRRSPLICHGARQLHRLCVALALVLLFGGVALAAEPAKKRVAGDDFSILREALTAADRRDPGSAQKIAERAKSPLPLKIVQWLDYRRDDSKASFAAIAGFITDNPDWPNINDMEASAERAMGQSVPRGAVLKWFSARDPVSREGRLQLLDATQGAKLTERATKLARQTWIDDDFGAAEENDFLARFGWLLRTEDHQDRLNRLLWENSGPAARRMFSRVDKGWQALAEARLALHGSAKNAAKLLAKLPAQYWRDSGLNYERVRWRRLKGKEADARALLIGAKAVEDHASLWWQERRILARNALEAGASRDAYRLVSAHGLTGGSAFAEAEFLAGWIALRHRGDAKTALKHFTKLHDGVSAPISLSRAAYWAGRAAEATADAPGAKLWFERAAAWPATYYGQLAAARAQGKAAPLFTAAEPVPPVNDEKLPGHDLLAAAHMLALLGEDELVTPFVLRLGELARGPADHRAIAKIAVDISRPDLAVRAAKLAASRGFVSVDSLYPLASLPLADADRRLEQAIIFAITRQESQFDPIARSPAGALGLMQLMPATAKQIAKKVGIKILDADLTRKQALNIRLGSRFLADLISGFDGSYVLAIAAYNAGPGNVRKWLKTNGDLIGNGTADPIDWIESIPFEETRNYVQRVLEGVQVYRWRLGQPSSGAQLERDLVRGISPKKLAVRCKAQPTQPAGATSLRTVC